MLHRHFLVLDDLCWLNYLFCFANVVFIFEIEVTGENKESLEKRLDEILKLFADYPIVEEPENYNKLSRIENAHSLENKKLKDYSKEALKQLQEQINFI